jgi:hypothetical protein
MLITTVWVLSGCTKSSGGEEDQETKKRADEFSAAIRTYKFKPVSFYSDKPIDYITNDTEVRAETDLWIYVKEYIKDDVNLFNTDGTVTIFQNAIKFPGNDAATISTAYEVSTEGKDVRLNFVDYNYVATKYKLDQFDNAFFTVYIDGPSGSKLYSKFARVE